MNKVISYILLFFSAVVAIIGGVLFFSERAEKRTAVLSSLEKARWAKLQKSRLSTLQEEENEINESIENENKALESLNINSDGIQEKTI